MAESYSCRPQLHCFARKWADKMQSHIEQPVMDFDAFWVCPRATVLSSAQNALHRLFHTSGNTDKLTHVERSCWYHQPNKLREEWYQEAAAGCEESRDQAGRYCSRKSQSYANERIPRSKTPVR